MKCVDCEVVVHEDHSWEQCIRTLKIKLDAQTDIVNAARFVMLAWLGYAVDDGRALREALPRLVKEFGELEP